MTSAQLAESSMALAKRLASQYARDPRPAPLPTADTSEGRLLAAILSCRTELRGDFEGLALAIESNQAPRRPTLHTEEISSADRVRELLRRKLRDERFSFREVERLFGLGHGTVANILGSRSAFKLEHLDLFARLFKVSPLELFAEAHGVSLASPSATALPPHLAEPDQLKDLLREVLCDSDHLEPTL
jgi:transcriptional regulator with XRE-family HTH domain